MDAIFVFISDKNVNTLVITIILTFAATLTTPIISKNSNFTSNKQFLH